MVDRKRFFFAFVDLAVPPTNRSAGFCNWVYSRCVSNSPGFLGCLWAFIATGASKNKGKSLVEIPSSATTVAGVLNKMTTKGHKKTTTAAAHDSEQSWAKAGWVLLQTLTVFSIHASGGYILPLIVAIL